MQLQRRPREDITVNLTPLIDVVFLLLIFFMVTTSFTRDTQITIELPTAEGGAPMEAKPKVIEISIDGEGRFFLNTVALVNSQTKTIIRGIEELAGGDTKLPIVISADAQAPYQSVVTAMDAAGQAGFVNITMATRKPPEEE